MINVTITDADRITGLLAANAALVQKTVDLEIINASLKRLLVEKDVADAAKPGALAAQAQKIVDEVT